LIDHAQIAIDYARRVIDRKIVAGKWVRLACARFLKDLNEAEAGIGAFWFSQEAVRHICAFIETLPHVKGDKARNREPIRLEPFQVFILAQINGWRYREKSIDGRYPRRFRTVYIEMPRKNAKSTILAGLGLYMTAVDGEGAPNVYSAATTRKQAREVFGVARSMVDRSPKLRETTGLRCYMNEIRGPHDAEFSPLASQTDSLDGLNPSCAIVDELHAHRKRDTWDVLDSAFGARSSPLLVAITTAGENVSGVCYEEHTRTRKILEGVFENPTYFGIIYAIDEDDDPGDPVAWRKANPGLGTIKSERELADQWMKAGQSAQSKGEFLRKHLGVWTSIGATAFELVGWNRGAREGLTIKDFEGLKVVLALDLAIRHDLSSLCVAAERPEGGFLALWRHWQTAAMRDAAGNEHFEAWARDGYLRIAPGSTQDFTLIKAEILALAERLSIAELRYDPHLAHDLVRELEAEGITCIEFRQRPMEMTEPMQRLMGEIADGEIEHDGDPVARWAISNVIAQEYRGSGFVRPEKMAPADMIDPAVALIMARSHWCVSEALEERSVYEDRPPMVM